MMKIFAFMMLATLASSLSLEVFHEDETSGSCRGKVTVYQHGWFNGKRGSFGVGSCDFRCFMRGFGGGRHMNDQASSIKVPRGCKAVLYQHAGFKGWRATFNAGKYDIHAFRRHGARNDDASSIKVFNARHSRGRKKTAPAATCRLEGDPHILDFRGKRWNHYASGMFIAYQKGSTQILVKQGPSTTWGRRATIHAVKACTKGKCRSISVDQRNCRSSGNLKSRTSLPGGVTLIWRKSCRRRRGDRHFNVYVTARDYHGAVGACAGKAKGLRRNRDSTVVTLAKKVCGKKWSTMLRKARKVCGSKKHRGCQEDHLITFCNKHLRGPTKTAPSTHQLKNQIAAYKRQAAQQQAAAAKFAKQAAHSKKQAVAHLKASKKAKAAAKAENAKKSAKHAQAAKYLKKSAHHFKKSSALHHKATRAAQKEAANRRAAAKHFKAAAKHLELHKRAARAAKAHLKQKAHHNSHAKKQHKHHKNYLARAKREEAKAKKLLNTKIIDVCKEIRRKANAHFRKAKMYRSAARRALKIHHQHKKASAKHHTSHHRQKRSSKKHLKLHRHHKKLAKHHLKKAASHKKASKAHKKRAKKHKKAAKKLRKEGHAAKKAAKAHAKKAAHHTKKAAHHAKKAAQHKAAAKKALAKKAAAKKRSAKASATAKALSKKLARKARGGGWHKCAREHAPHGGNVCRCNGVVRYGARGRYHHKQVRGHITCSNGSFGDPIHGVVKDCHCLS